MGPPLQVKGSDEEVVEYSGNDNRHSSEEMLIYITLVKDSYSLVLNSLNVHSQWRYWSLALTSWLIQEYVA
jgi:hypothetical protein